MKIVHISDSHNHPLEKALKGIEGNLLIHSGDITGSGTLAEVRSAVKDLALYKPYFDEIILVPGNHDFLFEEAPAIAANICHENDIIMLNDSGLTFDDIKIWGSPISPWFHDWAFNRHRGEQIQKHWAMIPEDTQILITHGPVFGILDQVLRDGSNVGCEMLRKRIAQLDKLKLHLTGHIHEAYGIKKEGNVTYSNASLMNIQYRFVNKPNIFEWENL